MKILVIGGSYFLGRVFTMLASEKHQLTLLNRGTYSMNQFGVNEIIMDRHDKLSYSKINDEFDVVVDFCAYEKGDIKQVMNALKYQFKKYIFVSTCDVYERNLLVKDENTPFNYSTSNYPDEIKKYIDGKVVLEEELNEEANKLNVLYTSVRPGMIYGPYNYAPRESWYIKNIVQNNQAIFPKEDNAKFQLVYVKDVVNAILRLCEEKDIDHAYNICSDEYMNYEKLKDILRKVVDVYYNEFYLTQEELDMYNLNLPFPMYKEETQLYDGNKIVNDFNFKYTSYEEGIKKTYNAFKNVYK